MGWMFNIYLIVVAVIASAVVLMWKNNHGVPIDKI
jgi:MHS family alpha-ketoglutarate permease-like MFS transporter